MAKIDDYKARLGYGARTNLFSLNFTLPFGVDAQAEEMEILVHKINWPAERPITEIGIKYQGDDFKIAGDKGAVEDITIEFMNAENFNVRNALVLWHQTIQRDITGLRTSPELYKANVDITILDHLGQPIKKVKLVGAWPKTIDSIPLDASADGTIVPSSVVLSIDWFEEQAV